jgi:hypothetical protein
MTLRVSAIRPRFSPKQIAGLQLWLDASDASTLTTISGGVSEWRDKSAAARDFSQTTANNRPTITGSAIGGKPALTFDGSNDFLRSSSNAGSLVFPSTIFIVANKSTNAAAGGLITHYKTGEDAYNSSSAFAITTNADGSAIHMLGASGTGLYSGIGSPSDALGSFIVSLTIASNSAQLRNLTSGASVTDSSFTFDNPATNNGLGLGVMSASFGNIHQLAGDIAEVIGYSRALSATEHDTIARSLARKYGLTLA